MLYYLRFRRENWIPAFPNSIYVKWKQIIPVRVWTRFTNSILRTNDMIRIYLSGTLDLSYYLVLILFVAIESFKKIYFHCYIFSYFKVKWMISSIKLKMTKNNSKK